MKSRSKDDSELERREFEFDYSKAVWGKHYRRLLKEGANVAVLDPDIAKRFSNSAAVNDALRSLLEGSGVTRRATVKSDRRSEKPGSAGR